MAEATVRKKRKGVSFFDWIAALFKSKRSRDILFALFLVLQCAFPDDDEVPALFSPRLLVVCVSADVSAELLIPKRPI